MPGTSLGRRSLLGRAAVAGSGALLAACGAATQARPPAAGATEAPRAPARPNVTLEYWSRWAQPTSEVEDKRISEWMAANGPTRVERTSINPYLDKLAAAFAGGSGPDLYSVGGTAMANFAAKGAALSLTSSTTIQRELPDFFPPLVEASKYQGRLIALPYIMDVRAMVHRKDFLQDAGLDPNKFPDTWDAFRDAAKRMTKRENGVLTRAGYGMEKSGWGAFDLFMVLTEMGGEHAFAADLSKPTFTGRAGQAALQLMVELVNKDQVDGFDRPAPPPGVDPLIAGVQAVTFTSAGPVNNARRTAPEQAAHLGVAPIPKLTQRWTLLGGSWLMGYVKPKDADAAMDLMVYLTAAKHADEISSIQNAVPPRKSAISSPYVNDPVIKVFFEAASYGWIYPSHAYLTEFRDLIAAEIEAAVRQTKSVQAALEDAAKGTQEYLNRK
jgi:multiple sugar transport system substrate-binding protein